MGSIKQPNSPQNEEEEEEPKKEEEKVDPGPTKLDKSNDDVDPAAVPMSAEKEAPPEEEEEDESEDGSYSQAEIKAVDEMIEKFLVSSDSAFLETIDLKLLLMAMPTNISESKIKRTMLFDFPTLQDSLLTFLNSTPSQAFQYYDSINIDRVHKIR